VGSVSATVVLW